jgi:SNF2 family DNA or RNA helicase
MPHLFESKDDFNDWFNFSTYDERGLDDDKKFEMVKVLHKIMKPFFLRRTKAELVNKLPDKIEINISVKLT